MPGRTVERRSFPRPPVWLNLLLLIIAIATFAYAKHRRDVLTAERRIQRHWKRDRLRVARRDMGVRLTRRADSATAACDERLARRVCDHAARRIRDPFSASGRKSAPSSEAGLVHGSGRRS